MVLTERFVNELNNLDLNAESVDNCNDEVVVHFSDRDSAIAAMSEVMIRLYDGVFGDESVSVKIVLRQDDWMLVESLSDEEE